MKLKTYFRSTAAYRVRIALNIKGIAHELDPIDLFAGEHKTESFTQHNPDGLIPTLEVDGHVLSQSMAILEFLEESYPKPALLPSTAIERANVRALSQTIVSDMHPLNNLRVYTYLMNDLGIDENAKMKWYFHWLEQGFKSFETRLSNSSNNAFYCFGDAPSLADCCLIPQVYNATRFDFDLTPYPTIQGINQHCLSLPAFADAQPENQADAQ